MQGAKHGGEELSIGGIAAEFPDHDSAEVLTTGVTDFVANRDAVFIGPESLAVKQPRCLRARVTIRGEGCGERTDVVIWPVATDSAAGLKEAVACVRNSGPTVPIKGKSHEQFALRNSVSPVAGDAAFNAAGMTAGEKWREESGGLTPGPGVVVVHDSHLIDQGCDRSEIGARHRLGTLTNCDGKSQAGPDGVHLAAKFHDQGAEIGGVVGLRRFPVDVNAIEQAWLAYASCEVGANESVYAGGHKGVSVFRLCIQGEIAGLSFEGDEDSQARVAAFQFPELMEIAAEGRIGPVRHAVDAGFGRIDHVEIRIGIGQRATPAAHRALRVIDLVKVRGTAIRDQRLQVKGLRIIDTSLGEVTNHKRMIGMLLNVWNGGAMGTQRKKQDNGGEKRQESRFEERRAESAHDTQ